MRSRMVACAVATFVVFVAVIAAQADRGRIIGLVRDTSGAVLPGVTVSITGPVTRTAVTNVRGEFAFANLAPGTYEVRWQLAGFVTQTRRIIVASGTSVRVDAQLAVGALEETISVAAESPQVDRHGRPAASPNVAGVIGGIAALPVVAPTLPEIIGGARPFDRRDRAGAPFNTEAYDHIDENPFRPVASDPLSTFSIDVDTASYANVRRFLADRVLPPPGAVRIEELINYFRFDYQPPRGDDPIAITTELAAAPWNPRHRLALIGIQGRPLPPRDDTPRNLVFLLDVSGSMTPPDKLPLVRAAMRMLTDQLGARDRVAIVVYAGASGLVLPSTTGDRKEVIHRALANLEAGGSTNGADGIRLAYRVAREHFIRGGVNRVLLATDGDFNVGVTSQDELVRLIERERGDGIFLSVLGVGTENLKDSTMEKLADKGNGNYSYLDSLAEARKVLVREGGGTLTTIAKDVKIQIEFNPRAVSAYRLIGYENRILQDQDFNDDRKDAGDIGAGHTVTALYELVPAGEEADTPPIDRLRYQQPLQPAAGISSAELATVKVRYKQPDGETSRLIATTIRNAPAALSPNIGFAAAVAEFGMLLRESPLRGAASYRSAAAGARRFVGEDPEGYRTEFVKLVRIAAELAGRRTADDTAALPR